MTAILMTTKMTSLQRCINLNKTHLTRKSSLRIHRKSQINQMNLCLILSLKRCRQMILLKTHQAARITTLMILNRAHRPDLIDHQG